MHQRRHVWLAIASTLLISACSGQPAPNSTPEKTVAAAPAMSPAERGKYLVNTAGCNDCHTPLRMGPNGPEPDMTRMLSGHPETVVLPPPPPLTDAWNNVGSASGTAFAGPWGITFAFNLTPDPETGIGKWREKDFVQAIKTGKHMGVGRPIQP